MYCVYSPDYEGRRFVCNNHTNDTNYTSLDYDDYGNLLDYDDYGNSSDCNRTWVGNDNCMGSLSYIETYYVFLVSTY